MGVTSSVIKCTRELLDQTSCHLMEPMMKVEISTGESQLGPILGELSRRHAVVNDVFSTQSKNFVHATAPVAEMKGYASYLRSSTSGNADLSLQVCGYEVVSEERLTALKNQRSSGVL